MSQPAHEILRLAKDARVRLGTLKLPEPAVKICVAGLAHMEKVLAQPPRVAIMGEVNSGKTSIADLLLGAGVLPSSVVVNTHVPVLIKYADEICLDAITQQGRRRLTDESLEDLPSGLQLKRIEIGLPSERLRAFEILDTPGGYVPGAGQPDAQIFVWCTVASRAWTESERAHWSELPRRCRRNGLLAATHKDALAHMGDVERIAQRLAGAATELFRDVVFVTATGPSHVDARSTGADDLLVRIATWAAEIRMRRALKAERIIRHLARLTFHRLMPGPLSADAGAILKAWERDCDKLLTGVDGSPAGAARVIQAMLTRFAHSVSEARAGRISSRPPMVLAEKGPQAGGSYRAAAMRRYIRLIGADLTALLRIDLAQWGLREPTHYLDYATARSILLPLANLDATFEELGQHFAAPGPSAVPPRPADTLRTGTRLA